ncbi:MAG: ribonucleotide reductase N-terminal alpha domain-containing protein [Syntrophobacterales bacterium]
MEFRPIVQRVLEERYLRRDPEGRVMETPEELFRRVARAVAAAELRYGGEKTATQQAEAFHEAMATLKFLPNTPTLMNAGIPQGQLAACFVIPIADDMRSIMEGVRDMSLIHQTGGGTGFSFTHLRPRGDQVRCPGRVASGPVGFMRIVDTTTDVVKQGGRRRGANMGILNVDHPDITEFIQAKAEQGPCGEQPLLPFESCNLGSINLSRLVTNGALDWDELDNLVKLAITFLDDVLDQSHYPLPQISAITRANRKVGLGVMGLADMFIKLNMAYDSLEALELAEKIMACIAAAALEQSQTLAQTRGPFPNFHRSRYYAEGQPARRHATVTTVAPTGTISLIAGVSSGIEPLFAVSYRRRALEGEEFDEVNPLFLKKLKDAGLEESQWLPRVQATGRVRPLTELPESLRRLFPTTFEVSVDYQVQMQAAFQKHVENAVSKTINLSPEATQAEVQRRLYEKDFPGCNHYASSTLDGWRPGLGAGSRNSRHRAVQRRQVRPGHCHLYPGTAAKTQ